MVIISGVPIFRIFMVVTLSGEATFPFSFLGCLYECTGRAIALPPASALALALAAAWTKNYSFTLKFLCDGQGAVRGAILYADRSSCLPSQWGSTLEVKNLLL